MDEKLALSILQVIEKDESFGFFSVQTEIKKMELFYYLTDEKYNDTFGELRKNECLLPRGIDRDCYRLNPEKNCIKKYSEKLASIQSDIDTDAEIKSLTAINLKLGTENLKLSSENLRLSSELLPLQKKELKGRIFWGILGALGGSFLTFLVTYLKEILKFLKITHQ